jgi:hypothetical protein
MSRRRACLSTAASAAATAAAADDDDDAVLKGCCYVHGSAIPLFFLFSVCFRFLPCVSLAWRIELHVVVPLSFISEAKMLRFVDGGPYASGAQPT